MISKLLVIIGGIVAIIGQWVTGYYLPVIGGAIAVIGGLFLRR